MPLLSLQAEREGRESRGREGRERKGQKKGQAPYKPRDNKHGSAESEKPNQEEKPLGRLLPPKILPPPHQPPTRLAAPPSAPSASHTRVPHTPE